MNNNYRQIGAYLGIGLNLAITLLLFVYGGDWLDKKFPNTQPFGLIICSIIGLAVGLYHLIKTVTQLEKNNKDE